MHNAARSVHRLQLQAAALFTGRRLADCVGTASLLLLEAVHSYISAVRQAQTCL
jgi:hypothetical protein